MLFRKRNVAALFLGTVVPIGSAGSAPDSIYPHKPITVVVGFPPGGPTDALARIVAQGMSEELGQKVVVENRPGAAGNVAAAAVARSQPDGYTVYLASRANVLSDLLNAKAEYRLREFAPVGMLATVEIVFVVGKQSPVTDIKQFIAQAKANPGALTCASGGVGSTSHMLCELFQAETGTSMLHVPYRGAGPALIDIIRGQIDSKFDTLPSSLEHIRRGDLRPIALLSRARSRFAPDIPALEEAGGPPLYVDAWYGLLAPADTPVQRLDRLNKSLNNILRHQGVRDAYMRAGYSPPSQPNSRDVLANLLVAEAERWYRTTNARGIRID